MTTTITFEFSLEKVGESIALRNEISSTQVDNFFYFAFKGPDNFYTYIFRLWRMITHDLVEKKGGTFPLPSEGLIGTVSQEPLLATLITLTMLGFSLLAAVYYCLKEKEKEEEQKKIAQKDYKNSNAQIKHWMDNKTTCNASLSQEAKSLPCTAADEVSQLNQCLQQLLKQPQYQSYANATIKKVENEHKISLALGKKTKLSLANISDASWKAGMQAAFIYWIGWIATGCITGMLTVGIFGVAPWLAFGVPLFVGALPRLVQIWHWVKRHLEIDPQSPATLPDTASYLDRFKHVLDIKSQPTPEDVAIANQLMLSCIRERELELECKNLSIDRECVPFYKVLAVSNKNSDYLVDYAATKILAAGFLLAVSMYGMAHYILWLASDIFPAILLSSTLVDFLSIAAFAVAGIYGIVGMWKKLNEIEKDKLTYQFDNNILLEEYHKIQHEISQQTSDLIYQMPLTPHDYKPKDEPISEPILLVAKPEALTWENWFIENVIYLAKGVGEFFEHPIPKFFDRAMGGGFVTRVFLLLCTSPFLPSGFHMAAAVAVLSNPATVAIIAASFLVWGTFRYYLDKVTDKEKQIRKELAEEVTKKETIVHAIQLANIKLAALNKPSRVGPELIPKEKSVQEFKYSRSQSKDLQPTSGWCEWASSFFSRTSDRSTSASPQPYSYMRLTSS